MQKQKFKLLAKILAITGSLFYNTHANAKDLLVDTAKNTIDTTSVRPSDIFNDTAFIRCASFVPFHHSYLLWDTEDIHPDTYYKLPMDDSVTLVLADAHDCGFATPVHGVVTSPFGPRTPTRYHYGVDLELNTGDTVVSAFDGIVRISQWSSTYGYTVVVRHYNGLETLYAHLSKMLVEPGKVVRAGEIVGLGGSTGRSTGPHLHFEVRYLGRPINPNNVISFSDSTGRFLYKDSLTLKPEDFEYIDEFKAAAAKYKAETRYYTIRRGDNLSVIAARNRTTVNRLCQLNRISRNATLYPGRRLRIR